MAETTTDHDTIRKWAEGKGGKPAAVKRTHKGDDVGIIRIMFPDNPQSEHDALTEITWDEFFASSRSASWRYSTTRRACSPRSSAATPPRGGRTATTRPRAEGAPGAGGGASLEGDARPLSGLR